MKAEDLEAIASLPPSTLCRRINFENAQVRPGIVPKTWFLIVSGKKPWASMTVELQPLIYVHQPDYWGIEVVGCVSGISLPVEVPYSVWLDIRMSSASTASRSSAPPTARRSRCRSVRRRLANSLGTVS